MWWRKKKLERGAPQKLIFKSPQSFFEMQCKYGVTQLENGLGIVALVVDGQDVFGKGKSVDVLFGVQKAMLRIASYDGGFDMMAQTGSANGDILKPDDLVIWVPRRQSDDLARIFPDKRSALVGTIVAKVAPEMSLNGEFTILFRYE